MNDQEIAELQGALLRSVLTGGPLLGTGPPVGFPDIAFINRQPTVLVEDENLEGKLPADAAPSPRALEVLSRGSIVERARAQGEIAYLAFGSPAVDGEEVTLTLRGRLVSRTGQVAGLSGVQVRFRRAGDGFEPVGDPVYSSA